MTTPANPTPEPTPITDAARQHLARYAKHSSLDEEELVWSSTAEDLERQLSDTRRRLAEVEKERDDARAAIKQAIELLEKTNAERKVYKRGFHSAADNLERRITALRNAADGMAGKMLGAIVILKAVGDATNNAAAKLAVT